ncbi:MAG: CpaF family protein [Actinomycetota bacterium]
MTMAATSALLDAERHLADLIRHLTDVLVEYRQKERRSGREPELDHEVELARTSARAFFDRRISESVVSGLAIPDTNAEADLTRRAIDTLLGFGPLQRLLNDPDITDIHVRGSAPIWVKRRDGSRLELDPVVASDDELVRLVRNVASRSRHGERRFDASTVECNLCLDDGSRLFAVMDVSQHPALVIRKHQLELASLDELRRGGSMSEQVATFLRAAVLARRNVIVVGGTGSGKTTLLRALINEIPFDERIVTIEDAYELGIERFAQLHPDHDALQSRSANIEGHGAIPLSDLTRMALRMDPDRVIIGEVRGAEAFPMLLAMSQGNNGSMCTLHADSTQSAFSKLAAYVSMANTGLPVEVVNLLIATAVHLVVHVELSTGRRKITGIREVVDSDGPRIVSNELFSSVPGSDCRVAYPMSSNLRVILAAHGYDESSESPAMSRSVH